MLIVSVEVANPTPSPSLLPMKYEEQISHYFWGLAVFGTILDGESGSF